MNINMDRKTKQLGKNFGLFTIGSFASKILTFLLVPLYTNILSTAEYGIVDLINTTVSLTFPLAILVISEAVIRFSLDGISDKKQVWSIGFYVNLLGCVLLTLLSPLLLFTVLRNYVFFYVLSCFALSFHQTVSQFIKGNNSAKLYAAGGIINTIAVIALNIIFLLLFKLGLPGYLIAISSGHIITVLFYFFSAKLWKYFIPITRIDKKQISVMLRYSLPMLPNSISWWINDSSDKYIVQYFCGLSVNGIYAISYKIPTLMTTISNLFISAWQISAFEDFGSEESIRFFNKIANDYIKFNLIICSGLIFLTRPIAFVLFAADFYNAWKYTPILILAFVFSTLSSFWGTIYTAAKKTKMLFYSTLIGAGVNILLDLILTPLIGAYGAAIATLLSYLTIFIIRVFNSMRIIHLDIQIKTIIVSFIFIVIELCFYTYESYLSLIIAAIISICICIINRSVLKDYLTPVLFMFKKPKKEA